MDDDKLVQLALDGDDNALKILHDRYVQQLFRYALVQTSNYHDAEEVLQDIFYKMAKNLAGFQGKSSFKTWLFTIARHTMIDYYRKQKNSKRTTSMLNESIEIYSEQVASAEDEVMQRNTVAELMKALQQLPVDYRTVLDLRFIQGFSIKDTAKVMSKTAFSIKSLQHRARKKLVALLGNEVSEQ